MDGVVVEMDGKPYRFPVARAEVDPSDSVNPAWTLDGRRDDTFQCLYEGYTELLGDKPTRDDALTHRKLVAEELLLHHHPDLDQADAHDLVEANWFAIDEAVMVPAIGSWLRARFSAINLSAN
jgi:hypothetical protein